MTVYTFSEARQRFASLLERARREGQVRVRRRDGQVFVIRPERSKAYPLAVKGLDIGISADEIVGFVRESRERAPQGTNGARGSGRGSRQRGGARRRRSARR